MELFGLLFASDNLNKEFKELQNAYANLVKVDE